MTPYDKNSSNIKGKFTNHIFIFCNKIIHNSAVTFHQNYHDDHHRYNSDHQHYNYEHPGITQQLVGGEDAVQAFMR